MPDLSPVNPLFNSKLEIIRSELLSQVMSKWDDLEDIRKSEMIRMDNFFCKLHLTKFKSYINKDYEKQFAFNTKDPSPTQLIRFVMWIHSPLVRYTTLHVHIINFLEDFVS